MAVDRDLRCPNCKHLLLRYRGPWRGVDVEIKCHCGAKVTVNAAGDMTAVKITQATA